MDARSLVVPALVLVACLLPFTPDAEGRLVPILDQLGDTELRYAYAVQRKAGLDPRRIWTSNHVTVNCSQSFGVVTANSTHTLRTAKPNVLWCGWRNIMSEPNFCHLRFSPLHDTYVGVKPTFTGMLRLGKPDFSCKVDAVYDDAWSEQYLNMLWTAAAVTLFLNAAQLAQSQNFRLTSGALMGVTGALVIVLFVIIRNTPAKRAIGAGFALSASGMLALFRWLFGTWAPGFHELVFSRFAVWYVLITAAAGVGLTYWLDDPNNHKLHTSIRVVLQGIALANVYASIADEYCAVAAVVLLMTNGWIWAILGHVFTAVRAVGRLVVTTVRAVGRLVMKLFQDAEPRLVELPDDYAETSWHSSDDPDYACSDEDDDADDEGEEEVIGPETGSDVSQEEPGQQPPAAPTGTGWLGRFTWSHSAAAAAAGGVSAAGAPGGGELGSAPSFDSWAKKGQQQQQQHQHQAGLDRTPAAAAAPGTSFRWQQTAVALDRTQQQQRQQAPVQQPTGSPFSAEKKVLDLSQPRLSPAAAAAAGRAVLPKAAAAASGGPGRSPLASPGSRQILNPQTGRHLTEGGAKFQELLDQGWVPNWQTGSFERPAGYQFPSSAAVPSTRGAPSPAGNLRARKHSTARD